MRVRALWILGGLMAATTVRAALPAYAVTDLGPGDGWLSGAFAMNNKGQIAGATAGRAWIREPNGDLTYIDPLPGFNGTVPAAINDKGEVVGRLGVQRGSVCFGATAPLQHAFLYRDGTLTDLGTLPGEHAPGGAAPRSWATGVNDAGVVIGTSDSADGPVRPFVWKDGVMRAVDTWAGNAVFVSAKGEVTGSAILASKDPMQPFLWTHDRLTLLPNLDPGSWKRQGRAGPVSADGVIVGSSMASDGKMHAVFWKDGKITDLGGLLPVVTSFAIGIGPDGVIVGTSGIPPSVAPPNGTMHAVLWSGGHIADINDLISPDTGWELVSATAINNQGAILCGGIKNGAVHSLLLTPISAPPKSGIAKNGHP